MRSRSSTCTSRRWTRGSGQSSARRAGSSSGSEGALADAGEQRLALAFQLERDAIAELGEELAEGDGLLPPVRGSDREQLLHDLRRHRQLVGVEPAGRRQMADRGFDRRAPSLAALDHPLEHPQVLAEAGPQELAVRALPEPVDVEDPRRLAKLPP